MKTKFIKFVPSEYDNMFTAVVEINGDTFESRAVKRQNEWDLKNQFPNGFESWYETHFEIVNAISLQYERDSIGNTKTSQVQETEGIGGLYELAKTLTDEFENLHKGKKWGVDDDTQYFDAIEEFLNEKLK